MSASFSNAKKTFSQVVNGVTKLVAALFNSAYDEIEAEQTFIGPTGGGALSYTESLTNMLRQYRRGCAVEYKGAADLYVRAGEIMIVDADGNRRLRRNPSDTTVTWADIDTGAEANSTLYYVYAVADASGTTFTVKISTSATTPTGCTYYRRIGRFYNNGSGDIESIYDEKFLNPYNNNRRVIFSGTAPTSWTDLDLSAEVGANRALVFLKCLPSVGDSNMLFRTNGDTAEIGYVATNNPYGGGASAICIKQSCQGYILVETDASGIIEWKSEQGSVTCTIVIVGFLKG